MSKNVDVPTQPKKKKAYADAGPFVYSQDDHITKYIYGIDVKQTQEVVVINALTGTGKTRTLGKWVAENYGTYPYQLVIAFKEVSLAAEFICNFRATVKARNENEYNHLDRYVELVFNVTEDHSEKAKAALANDPCNIDLIRVIKFYSLTNASTSLKGPRFKALLKARVIITTHESVNNLVTVGLCAAREVIYDEEPANCHHTHEMSDNETKDGHLSKLLSLASTLDSATTDGKRIGRRIQSGVWTVSNDYHLTDSQVLMVNKRANSIIVEKIDEKSASCLGTTRKDRHSSIGGKDFKNAGGNVVDVGKNKRQKTKTKQNSSNRLPQRNSPDKFTHFFVSYINFSSFKARSITILTAAPQGTSVAWLEKLSGKVFAKYEPEVSKQRRPLVANAVNYLTNDKMSFSCSRTSLSSDQGKALIDIVLSSMSGVKVHHFIGCHAWLAKLFNRASINTCKLNQTGSNVYRHCTFVGMLNLSFPTPKERAIEEQIFGEDYPLRERWVLANSCGQTVMRSGLREEIPLPTVLFYLDKRVKEAFDLFIGHS